VLAALSEEQGGTGNRTRTWWHQIKINGVSMHDAVMTWWNATEVPIKCGGTEACPGGGKCPASGVCPSGNKTVHRDCLYNAEPSGNWSAPGVPAWPGSGVPPPNPDKRMQWYT